jgi:hypothetical protein
MQYVWLVWSVIIPGFCIMACAAAAVFQLLNKKLSGVANETVCIGKKEVEIILPTWLKQIQ